MTADPEALLAEVEAQLAADSLARARELLDRFAAELDRSSGPVPTMARAIWLGAIVALREQRLAEFAHHSEQAIAGLRRGGEDGAALALAALRAELLFGLAAESYVRLHGLPGFLEVCRQDATMLFDLAETGAGVADPRWPAIDRWRGDLLPRILGLLAEVTGDAPPLLRASRAFDLGPVDNILLLTAATIASHPSLRRRGPATPLAAGGDWALEAEFLARLCFADPISRQRALDHLGPGGRLVHHRLLVVAARAPLCVHAEPGLVSFLAGRWVAPPGAMAAAIVHPPAATPMPSDEPLAPSRRRLADDLATHLRGPSPARVAIVGEPGAGTSTVTAAAASALRHPLLRVDPSRLVAGADTAEVAPLLARDARLLGAIVAVAAAEVGEGAAEPAARAWAPLLEAPIAVVLEVAPTPPPAPLAVESPHPPDFTLAHLGQVRVERVLELPPLAADELVPCWQRVLTEAALPVPPGDELERLCRPYLQPGDLLAAARVVAANPVRAAARRPAGSSPTPPSAPSVVDQLQTALASSFASELARVAELLHPLPSDDPAMVRAATELADHIHAGTPVLGPLGLPSGYAPRPHALCVRLVGDDRQAEILARTLGAILQRPVARLDLSQLSASPGTAASRHLHRALVATARAGAVLCLARADILSAPPALRLANTLGTLLEYHPGPALLVTASTAPLPVALDTRVDASVELTRSP